MLLVTPLLMGPVCLLSQGLHEKPVRPCNTCAKKTFTQWQKNKIFYDGVTTQTSSDDKKNDANYLRRPMHHGTSKLQSPLLTLLLLLP